MPHPLGLITLLTDFGDRDSYVASMKGAILSICPEARIVDLSHQIAPHRIDEAGYFLKSCYREFPEGTIHVVVVDPGVGSARRAIAVKSVRYIFLAPDNGVLTYIFDDEQPVERARSTSESFCVNRRATPSMGGISLLRLLPGSPNTNR